MRAICIAALALLILAGVFWANFLSLKKQELSVLHEQTSPFESLLPRESDLPADTLAEPAPLCAQHVPVWNARPTPPPNPPAPLPAFTPIIPVPTPATPQVPVPDVATAQEPLPPLPSAPASHTAPASYIYFYTGVPVQAVPILPVPAAATSITSVSTVPMPMVSMPVVSPYSVPVFVPRVVPSRIGSPKLVYTNGVVIKPKVYYPHQPVRNSLRGVTP